MTRRFTALLALAFAAFSCTTEDPARSTGTDDGGVNSNDGGAAPGSLPDGATPPPPTGTLDAGVDGGLPSSGGIELTADGTTYTLTRDAGASRAGNGYLVVAQDIDGTNLRNFSIILTKGESSGGGTTYVVPTPGTYVCALPGAPPFSIARFQYSAPGGTTYQSPASPTCTVTLTEFGAVGERVKGTFSASLDRITGSGPTPITASGTFDVVRKN